MAQDSKKAVIGLFNDRLAVDRVVDDLRNRGFAPSDISVLFPEGSATREFAAEKNTKAPEGAAVGAGSGAVVGGTLGWLVGIGALAIPGLGPFIAAGPIVAALAGAGVGGTVGGLTGALIGMGIPEYEARLYEGFVKKGGILVSVHSADAGLETIAKEILKRHGAKSIDAVTATEAEVDRPHAGR